MRFAFGGEKGGAAGDCDEGGPGTGAGQVGARMDLARSQSGTAAAEERLGHWSDALDAYRGARQTWSGLRDLNALAPADAAMMARCERPPHVLSHHGSGISRGHRRRVSRVIGAEAESRAPGWDGKAFCMCISTVRAERMG
jgi:hypothetical protein